MRNMILMFVAGVLLCLATFSMGYGYGTHEGSRRSEQQKVTDYNDGFEDGQADVLGFREDVKDHFLNQIRFSPPAEEYSLTADRAN